MKSSSNCIHGFKRSSATFPSLRSLCGLLFHRIIPVKTVLLFGACVLGTSLGGVCGTALAEEGVAAQPKPHWLQLPVWGVEAEARGYQLPLPFGVGVSYYRELTLSKALHKVSVPIGFTDTSRADIGTRSY